MKTVFRIGVAVLIVALAWMPANVSAASVYVSDAKFTTDGDDPPSTVLDGVGHLVASPVGGDAERPQAGPVSKEDRVGLLKWIAAATLVAVPLAALFDGVRRRGWRRRS